MPLSTRLSYYEEKSKPSNGPEFGITTERLATTSRHIEVERCIVSGRIRTCLDWLDPQSIGGSEGRFPKRHWSEYVFSNRRGQARGYAAVSIRKAISRVGLADGTIHTLRHTHASCLIQSGVSIYEVREILGHSEIKTTMRYAHLEQQAVSARARDLINGTNAA